VTFIIDASVAAKWFFREPLADHARDLLSHEATLEAPDFLVTEVTNIAWKKVIRGEIAHAQAQLAAAGITALNWPPFRPDTPA